MKPKVEIRIEVEGREVKTAELCPPYDKQRLRDFIDDMLSMIPDTFGEEVAVVLKPEHIEDERYTQTEEDTEEA